MSIKGVRQVKAKNIKTAFTEEHVELEILFDNIYGRDDLLLYRVMPNGDLHGAVRKSFNKRGDSVDFVLPSPRGTLGVRAAIRAMRNRVGFHDKEYGHRENVYVWYRKARKQLKREQKQEKELLTKPIFPDIV